MQAQLGWTQEEFAINTRTRIFGGFRMYHFGCII